jgi:hypothetical protein
MQEPCGGRSGKVSIWALLLAAAVVIVGGWLIYDTFIKTDETRIRQLMERAAKGAAAKSPSEVSGILSDDFKGPEGISKDLVHSAMIQVLMASGFKAVEVTYEPKDFPVQIDAASKTARATFSIQARGRMDDKSDWENIPNPYVEPLTATYRKTDQGWRMDSIGRTSNAGKPR